MLPERKNPYHNYEYLGECPICNRDMYKNLFVDEHHLIPKSKDGKYGDKITIHRVCHEKIHSIWTEAELAGEYHTVERITSHPEMKRFAKWLKRKPPAFYVKTKMANHRKR